MYIYKKDTFPSSVNIMRGRINRRFKERTEIGPELNDIESSVKTRKIF